MPASAHPYDGTWEISWQSGHSAVCTVEESEFTLFGEHYILDLSEEAPVFEWGNGWLPEFAPSLSIPCLRNSPTAPGVSEHCRHPPLANIRGGNHYLVRESSSLGCRNIWSRRKLSSTEVDRRQAVSAPGHPQPACTEAPPHTTGTNSGRVWDIR